MGADPDIDVVCIGEALVDFVPDRRGVPLRAVRSFEKALGGSPANVATALARQGIRTAMVARVGDDEFGRYLVDHLRRDGVDVAACVFDPVRRTGITFLQVDAHGERSFLSFRVDAAEEALCADDIPPSLIERAEVVHLGPNTMMTEVGREGALHAVGLARRSGALVSVDVNARTHMWPSPATCRWVTAELVARADIVKVNDAEAAFLIGEAGMPPLVAARELCRMGPKLAVVTLGADGCIWAGPWGEGRAWAPRVDVIDTTGAGDAFVAGMLAVLSDVAQRPTPDQIAEAMGQACRLGAAAVSAWGATAGITRP